MKRLVDIHEFRPHTPYQSDDPIKRKLLVNKTGGPPLAAINHVL